MHLTNLLKTFKLEIDKIEKSSIGDNVFCDLCGVENSHKLGGSIVGSYALCPDCTKKFEPREIDRHLNPEMTFKDNVLILRIETNGTKEGISTLYSLKNQK